MTTAAYPKSDDSAMTGTAAATGKDFVLSTGSSRTFFTVPTMAADETLILQIRQVGSSNYIDVGRLNEEGESISVVTARGAGDSTFRVNKSATGVSVAVFFD